MSQGGRAFLNDELECELDDPDKLDESSSDDDEPDSKPTDIRNQVFATRSDDPSGIACAHAKGKDGECKYGVRCFCNSPPTDEEAVAAGVRPPPLDSG